MYKKILAVAAVGLMSGAGLCFAQGEKQVSTPYQFTVVKEVPATPVKDQYSSGTCWSFAGIGLMESELLRMGKGEYDLSEMWVVRHGYLDRARKYVRMHGKAEFAQGGSFCDVVNAIRDYGIVPDEVYTGLQYGSDKHRHSELESLLQGYVHAVIGNQNGALTPNWTVGLNGILDAYLGEDIESFVYEGVEYTPQSFAKHLGLDMDNYVSITSYTHHPFYSTYAIEVPDNWAWGLSYNVPLDELMEILNNAINEGYAVNWGADVSEPGFVYSKGFAVLPDSASENNENTEWSKWENMSDNSKRALISNATEPFDEITVTQELRQVEFDNYKTTDDHGMLITGIAVDQNGNTFYKVKNSWDTSNIYDGYIYASEPYVRAKTLNICMHKDAIPKHIRKKLGI